MNLKEDDEEQKRWVDEWSIKHKGLKLVMPWEIIVCLFLNVLVMITGIFETNLVVVLCGAVCVSICFANFFFRDHWTVL